ncbi:MULTISPECIES: hypothetical protein [unclassified Arthrobacter]|uniref:hypothetical protein n=1 Tax=unclassified Arthrobacter TaxID=235627 RepID=UPI001D1541C3|nr:MULTISPECIES: hypothetical protein [unclassified Arthrobacter]MCC3279926.1 hypothetical protein [Arthrobacter sp. zg-Y40]MCC9178322.1 hypothetical protein [Arthrobacter sp. zg-Y750]MDK1328275.1 hypothetical protein [Arthrobacter sp. zg-Y1143]
MDWLLVLTVVLVLAVGFGTGWLAKASVDRREGSRALNELVTYLHLKQTLAPIEPRAATPGPEVDRARSAVADLREKVIETLAQVHTRSGANEVLMRMAAACTRYLRVAGDDPARYQFELMELRRGLVGELRILSDGRRDVLYRGPGEHGAERAARKAAPKKKPDRPRKRGDHLAR